MSKSREWLGKAIFEAALITFSILFALWVDDWKEERDHRELAQQALVNFEREILSNQAMVKRQLEYHQRLQDALFRAVQQNPDRIRTLDQLWQEIQWKGLAPPAVLDTAWQTAVVTQALVYLDYQTVAALSWAYSGQTLLDKLAGSYFPILLSSVSNHQISNVVWQLSGALKDLIIQERQLLQSYDLALKQIRKERRPESAT